MDFLIATHNMKKREELHRILSPLGISVFLDYEKGIELSDVEEELKIALDCEDVDTFGGYVFSVLGIVPEDGETLTAETDLLEISVTEVKEHRIEKTVVRIKEKNVPEDGSDDE